MKDSKIISLLKVLNKKELKSLGKFLHSPYFNENEGVQLLFAYLVKCYPLFADTKVKREKVFAKLFPGEKFDDLKLRRLASQLLKLAEQYVAVEFGVNKKTGEPLSVLEFYEKRNLGKHYNGALSAFNNLQKKTRYKDNVYYYYEMLSQGVQIQHLLKEGDRSDKIHDHLLKAGSYLDIYYLITKLSYCCSVVNHSKVMHFDSQFFLVDELLTYISKSDYLQHPVIHMYYAALKLLREEGADHHFHQLKHLLHEHVDSISDDRARVLYGYAKNYCIRQVNVGKQEYFEELFGVFTDELEQLVVKRGLPMSNGNFKNIVTTGLRLQKFDWVEQFIYEHRESIASQHREDVFNYNLAHLHFYKKDYDKAITLLFQSSFKDIFFKIDSRKLLLQIYHEMDEWDARDNLINSLRVFIHSKKGLVSDTHIEKTRNFLNILTAITKVYGRDKEAAEKISDEIANTELLAEREWLREKAEGLR